MSREDYDKALKSGRKAFQDARANGQSPYLRVLEEDTAGIDMDSEVSLGVMDIPLDKIVGTNSHARSLSFAQNFMPLLPYGTEVPREMDFIVREPSGRGNPSCDSGI